MGKIKRLPEGAGHQKYVRRAMSDEEIGRFLATLAADDEENDLRAGLEGFQRVPQLPLFLALLETGGRWNEIRLATWGDVDLAERVLVLRAETTKSKRQRAIPSGQGLADRLYVIRVLQEEILGRLPNVGDRVFLSPEGRPWGKYTTNAMRIFDRVLASAGIPKVDGQGRKLDLHALRHTANTRWARNGVGLDHRQRLMGHSDPKLTAVTYSHLDVEDLRHAVERIDHPGPRRARSPGTERDQP